MKYKLAVSAFTASVIAVSTYGMLQPSYDLSLFLDLGTAFTRLRIMLALILLLYVWVPLVRIRITQFGMLFGGALCLAAGVTAIFSPMLLGAFSHYTALGDVIIAIEGGVLAILSGLELKVQPLPQTTPLFMLFMPAYYFQMLSKLQPPKPLATSKQLSGAGTA